MVYLLKDGILYGDHSGEPGERLCLIGYDQIAEASSMLGIGEDTLQSCLRGGMSKHESHEQFDYMSITLPDMKNLLQPPGHLGIFIAKGTLVLLSDKIPELEAFFSDLELETRRFETLDKLLCACFDWLTGEDYLTLEWIEQEISELEEALITSRKNQCIREIVDLRKRLMVLKRYYERFIYLFEGIEENENGLIGKHTLHSFRLLSARINRLNNWVNNLRDYVTQVREAYQAQVDINQNQIMKIFTVITAIFLPLTLIVGWYGMNFAMPEYNWRYGYPFVILASVVMVGAFIIFFKKKHWF